MTILHVADDHMVVEDIIQAVQDGVAVQTLAAAVGINADGVAGNTRLRVNIMDAGIHLIVLLAGIVVEAQQLALGLAIRHGVDVL